MCGHNRGCRQHAIERADRLFGRNAYGIGGVFFGRTELDGEADMAVLDDKA